MVTMQKKRVGTIPVDIRRINSHLACESCHVKNSEFRVTLKVPDAPTHYLCENCAGGFKG